MFTIDPFDNDVIRGEALKSVSFVLEEALSVLMLCVPVFIFTFGSSAFLGRPRCGLSI